jgi:hypothetical protein
MNSNPILGVFFHWLGGLASGSFYVPFRFVRRWSWETYWLVGGVFSWIIAPWAIAAIMTPNLFGVLGETSSSCFGWTFFWGMSWGLGGLTFGLTMRYLGMSLGMAVALGYCAVVGTLAPPIYHGTFGKEVLEPTSGHIILGGVVACLLGIAISGLAGMSKEQEMPEEEKKAAIKEFNFKKGILVATFSGVFSACFAFGLDSANPIKQATLKHGLLASAKADGYGVDLPTSQQADELKDLDQSGKMVRSAGLLKRSEMIPDARVRDTVLEAMDKFDDPGLRHVILSIAAAGSDPQIYLDRRALWRGLPALIVILLGGFATNFVWCVFLNIKNKTGYQYLSPVLREGGPTRDQETIIETAFDAPSEEVVEHLPRGNGGLLRVPLAANYFFSALAGSTWYMQFFFYQMGESQMGKYGFSSWTLHMASIIVFSTLWGIALREWRGSSQRTIMLVTLGLAVLIGSTIIVGYGNKVAKDEEDQKKNPKVSAFFHPLNASSEVIS